MKRTNQEGIKRTMTIRSLASSFEGLSIINVNLGIQQEHSDDDLPRSAHLNTELDSDDAEKFINSVEQNNTIDEALLESIELVAWDCDLTVTRIHTAKNEQMIDRMSDLTTIVSDLALFKRLNLDLIACGKKVGIASYGRKSVILKLMDQIFGLQQRLFTDFNVITPSDIVSTEFRWLENHEPPVDSNFNKSTLMDLLRWRLSISRPDRCLLFDDSLINIKLCIAKNYLGILIRPLNYTQAGFRREMDPILERIIEENCSLDEFRTRFKQFVKNWCSYLNTNDEIQCH